MILLRQNKDRFVCDADGGINETKECIKRKNPIPSSRDGCVSSLLEKLVLIHKMFFYFTSTIYTVFLAFSITRPNLSHFRYPRAVMSVRALQNSNPVSSVIRISSNVRCTMVVISVISAACEEINQT